MGTAGVPLQRQGPGSAPAAAPVRRCTGRSRQPRPPQRSGPAACQQGTGRRPFSLPQRRGDPAWLDTWRPRSLRRRGRGGAAPGGAAEGPQPRPPAPPGPRSALSLGRGAAAARAVTSALPRRALRSAGASQDRPGKRGEVKGRFSELLKKWLGARNKTN